MGAAGVKFTMMLEGYESERGLFVDVDQLIIALYKAGLVDFAQAMEQWKKDYHPLPGRVA